MKPNFDYLNIKPVAEPIPPKKQGKRRHWGSHPYFTRRAWNVVQEYIKCFSQPNDIVLDPFGGSGVTAIEALVLKRQAIHCDINPMANFMCQQIAVAPVSINKLKDVFRELEERCRPAIDAVYDMSGEEADKLTINHWYPKNVPVYKGANVEFVEELHSHRQLYSLSLLLHHINQIEDTTLRDLMRFTFSATLNKTNLTFHGTVGRSASRGNSEIMRSYRYMVMRKAADLNVWEQFAQKFKNTCKVKEETNREIGDFAKHLRVLTQSATDLVPVISKESVDYIYTDPPYGQHIAYLDLSEMWNAWLNLEVPEIAREQEVIEGGNLKKSKDDYMDLLEQSIEQMFQVLKYNRWMSLVFAHKDPAFWDTIIKAAESTGFEYVNTAVQTAWLTSWQKRKNPLKVLSGELVLNFRKIKSPKTIAVSSVGVDVVQLIKESAELTIVSNMGATTDQIYYALVPKLMENGLLSKVRRQLDDITPLLAEEFDFSEIDSKWRIRPHRKIGSYIPLEERIRFYVTDYLHRMEREGEQATFDDIVLNVMPNLINGTTPSNQTILSVLEEIAYSPDKIHWKLGAFKKSQLDLFGESTQHTGLPNLTFPADPNLVEHDSIIYALVKLGKLAGFSAHIGKKEQATAEWNGEKFKSLSIDHLPFEDKLDTWEKGKIEQIDLLWFDGQNQPVMAFEVETSTPITTGIDRFMELLKVDPGMAKKVVLIIPPNRVNKMNQLLKSSHYIGHPLYMENKLVYCYTDAIAELYHKLRQKQAFDGELLLKEVRHRISIPNS